MIMGVWGMSPRWVPGEQRRVRGLRRGCKIPPEAETFQAFAVFALIKKAQKAIQSGCL